MEPMAVRWQPQGGIVRSGSLEDGPQPQEAIHDLCWAGPRQSQATVPDLPRALWPSPQEGETPRMLLERVTWRGVDFHGWAGRKGHSHLLLLTMIHFSK